MVELEFGGLPLRLLPQRAAFLPTERTLLIADAHIGKAGSFRSLGVPVPSGTTAQTLAVLDALIGVTGVARIVFLGDLLHSRHAQQASVVEPMQAWRAAQAGVECVLVRGNHDSHAGDPPASLRFAVVDEPWPVVDAPGLFGCHHPQRVASGTVLAGHWHPAVTLRGPARDTLRVPCFCQVDKMLILPAFGAFTGSSPNAPPRGSTCYPVGGGRVLPGLLID